MKPIETRRLAIATLLAGFLASPTSLPAAEPEPEPGGWVTSRADVAPVDDAVYGQECGSCHMAYQPGLLPAASWQRIMTVDALADHYGDDASLADNLRSRIEASLSSRSADRSEQTRARAFAVALDPARDAQTDELPRITASSYFRRKHHEIPAQWVTGNPEVGSFSQCNACHGGAGEGVFNEHRVSIPGHGRWED